MEILLAGKPVLRLTDCEMHSHDCYEMILNTSGVGVDTIGDKDYPFEPGTIRLIPPNMPHRKTAKDGFTDIFLHTTGFDIYWGNNEPLTFKDDANHTIEHLMEMIHFRWVNTESGDIIVDRMYQVIKSLLTEWYGRPQKDEMVEYIKEKIALSFNDPEFSMHELLLSTGYSIDHIRRRFIACTGVTPGKYLTLKRINYAKQMLAQADSLRMSIAEIAVSSGYYDTKYFSRIFKAETGKKPSQWRY